MKYIISTVTYLGIILLLAGFYSLNNQLFADSISFDTSFSPLLLVNQEELNQNTISSESNHLNQEDRSAVCISSETGNGTVICSNGIVCHTINNTIICN